MLVTRTEAQIMKEMLKIKVHDKCCLIYETELEWEVTVIPFIKQGLINGDKCIYQMHRRDEAYIKACFANQDIDINQYIKSRQLLLIPAVGTLHELNSKNMDQIVSSYAECLEQYLNEGYSNIRLCSESIAKLLADTDSCSRFLEIQLRFNRDIYPRFPLKSLLQYHRREDNPIILKDAIISHHCIFKAGRIYRNPATVPSEIYFQHKDAAWEVEYWLRIQDTLMDSEKNIV